MRRERRRHRSAHAPGCPRMERAVPTRCLQVPAPVRCSAFTAAAGLEPAACRRPSARIMRGCGSWTAEVCKARGAPNGCARARGHRRLSTSRRGDRGPDFGCSECGHPSRRCCCLDGVGDVPWCLLNGLVARERLRRACAERLRIAPQERPNYYVARDICMVHARVRPVHSVPWPGLGRVGRVRDAYLYG